MVVGRSAARSLTSRQHHTDRENHLHVGVGRDVAEAHRHQTSKHKIEGRGVATLQLTRQGGEEEEEQEEEEKLGFFSPSPLTPFFLRPPPPSPPKNNIYTIVCTY